MHVPVERRVFPNSFPPDGKVCMKEGSPPVAPKSAKHLEALIVMMIGCASAWMEAGSLAEEHPAVAVLLSMLGGFAPLIGLWVFLIVISLLISFLINAVERTCADEGDGLESEHHRKSKWRHVAHDLPDLLAWCLSLKEHSPPAIRFS